LRIRTEAPVLALTVLVVMVVGGCSANVHVGSGSDTLSASDIAKEAEKQLNKKFEAEGLPPLPPVTCDGDLGKKVGDTTHCEAKGDFGKAGTGTLGITAKVASVDGDTGHLTFTTDKAGVQPAK
jgi:hypothetical protein